MRINNDFIMSRSEKAINSKNITKSLISETISKFKKYIPLFFKLSSKDEKKVIADVIDNAKLYPTLACHMKKEQNINLETGLLSSTFVIAYILAGPDAIESLLYPLLRLYIDKKDIKENKKLSFFKRMKNDILEARKENNSDFLESRKKIGLEGLSYLKSTIKNVILPYKI